MSDKVAELVAMLQQDDPSQWVAHIWSRDNDQRRAKIEEWKELRDYIFATDTSTTSNQSLPWKNSTTLPKLCQLRDNLHSNYLSHLFPNDNWLTWLGYTLEDSKKIKAAAIEAYMSNKTREGGFRSEVSKLLYDYIDYGNAFATAVFENKYKTLEDGSRIPSYIGPKAKRISPLDIVFNPLADTIEGTYKIVRSIKTRGELMKLAQNNPEQEFWAEALVRRAEIVNRMGGYSIEDFDKATGFQVDGFGNMYEYYQSNYFEILEFYGDFHNQETDTLELNRLITVVDRSTMVRNIQIPSWLGHAPIHHVGWRRRPDNLWSMGPLDNLVGMQYRIDHLENLKADAMDLIVHPPLKVLGEVEEFVWGPGAEIQIDENGDVQEVSKSLQGLIAADNNIALLEEKMELYAGAPREAMGVRTPGEKTLGEVNMLNNASSRIFQEKINAFEIELMEPLLNSMLETARRNMDGSDIIRTMDDDVGVQEFMTLTREDITAAGKIRPVGARHFAKQAQDLQNLNQVFNGPMGQLVAPHTSGKNLIKFIDDVVGIKAYNIFSENAALFEQQETQAVMQAVQTQAEAEAQEVPPEL